MNIVDWEGAGYAYCGLLCFMIWVTSVHFGVILMGLAVFLESIVWFKVILNCKGCWSFVWRKNYHLVIYHISKFVVRVSKYGYASFKNTFAPTNHFLW